MIKIYTDGSFKNGVSTHHFYAMRGNKRIKRRTFIGIDDTSVKAEATTIIKALQMIMKKGWNNVHIYTDSLTIVFGVKSGKFKNEDFRYINHFMNVTGTKLHWTRRTNHRIKKADMECKKMMKTKLRRVM